MGKDISEVLEVLISSHPYTDIGKIPVSMLLLYLPDQAVTSERSSFASWASKPLLVLLFHLISIFLFVLESCLLIPENTHQCFKYKNFSFHI